MSFNNIFGIAGSALNAQMVRMNSTASNMANAGTLASSPDEAYKAKRPVFEALLNKEMTTQGAQYVGGVRVSGMADDSTPNRRILDPGNPKADKDGFVEIVWLVEDGKAVARQVTTGIQSETHIQILEGLEEGETVVIGLDLRALREL